MNSEPSALPPSDTAPPASPPAANTARERPVLRLIPDNARASGAPATDALDDVAVLGEK